MNFILVLLVVFSVSFSVFYSFKTRSYRKAKDHTLMNFYNSKANISMGIMLISMGCIQFFTFIEEVSSWRVGVGLVFLALGSFNLVMGLRNYRLFSKEINKK